MELLQRLFYSAVGAASIFYFFVKISLSHWKNRGILHEKPKFLWGNLKGVGKKRHISQVLREIYEKYKSTGAPFIGFYAFIRPMVLILDLDVVKHILDLDFQNFTDRGLYHNVRGDALTGNLVQLNGEHWQQLRAKVAPLFVGEKLNSTYSTLVHVAETFRRTLSQMHKDDQVVFNINDLVDSYNVDVISSLAFGLEGNSLKYSNTEFRIMTKNYKRNRSLLKEYLANSFPNIARLIQYKSFDETASKYFLTLVQDKIYERSLSRRQRHNDFLQLFMELKRIKNRQERLDDQQVAAQAFSFILAGLEACNSSMSLCLYELALQPELQQRAQEEILEVLRKHGGRISGESIGDMKYLDQVFSETLRKHPPYPFLLRTTKADYEVPNSVFMLKEGNVAIIPIAAIHHDPLIYPSPERFDPDRFLPDVASRRHPMAWLPFGYGPRSCVALQLAKMQIKVGLISLLREFQFSPCPETEIPLGYDNKQLVLSAQPVIKLQLARI